VNTKKTQNLPIFSKIGDLFSGTPKNSGFAVILGWQWPFTEANERERA
tara:strand:- start:1539 stop:1682 length:144 start_codon:yes stop_codon:yes gene_type:complete